ncbi:hypothetical protein N7490_007855 [Penicillium lividum]|nr:hypothetical protein N7490_007855 [Penicillium lividum]
MAIGRLPEHEKEQVDLLKRGSGIAGFGRFAKRNLFGLTEGSNDVIVSCFAIKDIQAGDEITFSSVGGLDTSAIGSSLLPVIAQLINVPFLSRKSVTCGGIFLRALQGDDLRQSSQCPIFAANITGGPADFTNFICTRIFYSLLSMFLFFDQEH